MSPALHWYKAETHQLIQLIVKMGFATDELIRVYFNIGSYPAFRRLVCAMVASNQFQRKYSDSEFAHWRLSRAACYRVRSEGRKIAAPPHIKTIKHDETAALIAIKLARSGLVKQWESGNQLLVENDLRYVDANFNNGRKYPDIIVHAPGAGLTLALEAESTVRSSERYDLALLAYKSIPSIDAIIYVTDRQEVKRKVKSSITRLNFPIRERPIFFGSLNAMRNDPVICPIEHPERNFLFSEIIDLLRRTKKCA